MIFVELLWLLILQSSMLLALSPYYRKRCPIMALGRNIVHQSILFSLRRRLSRVLFPFHCHPDGPKIHFKPHVKLKPTDQRHSCLHWMTGSLLCGHIARLLAYVYVVVRSGLYATSVHQSLSYMPYKRFRLSVRLNFWNLIYLMLLNVPLRLTNLRYF